MFNRPNKLYSKDLIIIILFLFIAILVGDAAYLFYKIQALEAYVRFFNLHSSLVLEKLSSDGQDRRIIALSNPYDTKNLQIIKTKTKLQNKVRA